MRSFYTLIKQSISLQIKNVYKNKTKKKKPTTKELHVCTIKIDLGILPGPERFQDLLA